MRSLPGAFAQHGALDPFLRLESRPSFQHRRPRPLHSTVQFACDKRPLSPRRRLRVGMLRSNGLRSGPPLSCRSVLTPRHARDTETDPRAGRQRKRNLPSDRRRQNPAFRPAACSFPQQCLSGRRLCGFENPGWGGNSPRSSGRNNLRVNTSGAVVARRRVATMDGRDPRSCRTA